MKQRGLTDEELERGNAILESAAQHIHMTACHDLDQEKAVDEIGVHIEHLLKRVRPTCRDVIALLEEQKETTENRARDFGPENERWVANALDDEIDLAIEKVRELGVLPEETT